MGDIATDVRILKWMVGVVIAPLLAGSSVVAAALFWKRSTKYGAYASILSVVVLWIYFFRLGWESPGYTLGGTGVMPVAFILGVSALSMIVVSLLTQPPRESVLRKFFPSS